MKRPTQGGPFHLLASPRGLFASCGCSPLKGAARQLRCLRVHSPANAGSGRTAFDSLRSQRVLSRLENPIIKKPDPYGPGFSIMASPRGLFASCGCSPLKGAARQLRCLRVHSPANAGSGRTASIRFAHQWVLSRLENPIIKKPDPYGPGFSIMASPRGFEPLLPP